MKLESLQDLFVHELQDLYDAEDQIIKALPKMAEAASSEELKRAFKEHLEETKMQKERLEEVFAELEEEPKGMKCKGMEGLIKEGEHLLKEKGINEAVRDAGLIASAQKVEHYEICAYGTLRTFANELGFEDSAQILDEILNEESKTNEKLTELAESRVNQEAAR